MPRGSTAGSVAGGSTTRGTSESGSHAQGKKRRKTETGMKPGNEVEEVVEVPLDHMTVEILTAQCNICLKKTKATMFFFWAQPRYGEGGGAYTPRQQRSPVTNEAIGMRPHGHMARPQDQLHIPQIGV